MRTRYDTAIAIAAGAMVLNTAESSATFASSSAPSSRATIFRARGGVRVYGGERCAMEPAALAALQDAIAGDFKGKVKQHLHC